MSSFQKEISHALTERMREAAEDCFSPASGSEPQPRIGRKTAGP